MTQPPHLKRSLSLWLITLYGLGTTVGAGIYVLIGKVADRAGYFAPWSFLVAAVLAGLTALAFAELSARYPKSAGEALYVREAFGSHGLALAVGLLVVSAGVLSCAAISVGAAGYLREFIAVPRGLAAGAIIVLLGALAAWGISQSVFLAAALTLIEVGALLVIIGFGIGDLPALAPALPALAPVWDLAAWGGVFGGALLAFYAFIGFEDMVNVAEEVRDAPRNLPRAIILTLVLTTLIYLAVATIAVLAVPPAELAVSEAPLALLYERVAAAPSAPISLVAILASLNGALIQIIMASRVLYGLAQQGSLPTSLGRVHPVTRTPLVATGAAVFAVLVLALWLPIAALAELTSVITLTVFALCNLALLRIKRADPHPPGIIRLPAALPLLGFVVSAGFLGLELLRRLG